MIKQKPCFELQPEEPAGPAVRHMGLVLCRLADGYVPGILDDTDPEYLHQYRVNLRKLRSLLKLMKQALPPDDYRRLKRLTSDLVRPTGPVRDLDVFLSQRERYASMLPAELQAGLDELFRTFRSERNRARGRLGRRLRSRAHESDYTRLLQHLETAAATPTQAGHKPVGRLARRKIHKHYHKLIKAGTAVTDETPAEAIHALRIECKKLRYLIEFFKDISGMAQSKPLISELKKLQDVLGRFNDCREQQARLASYVEAGSASPQGLAAAGGLGALLHREQERTRPRIQSAFSAFASAGKRRAFDRILDGGEE